MKALSLTQPWASLVATGQKRVETRSWTTDYRGPIAIHAAKGYPVYARQFASQEFTWGRLPQRIPLGAIIATARLVEIKPTIYVKRLLSAQELRYGDYRPGRWAWFLEDIEALPEPIPVKGALGLWEWS